VQPAGGSRATAGATSAAAAQLKRFSCTAANNTNRVQYNMSMAHASQPLLVNTAESRGASAATDAPVYLQPWWMLIHFLSFFLGGNAFIAGSVCLYIPADSWHDASLAAAWFYIVGSIGFLTVDVLEFCTFATPFSLRLNILLSVCGSSLYLLGSVGFLVRISP
jgi:hypothetical protein